MKPSLLLLTLGSLLAGLLSVPAMAHHGTVEYQEKMIVLTGTGTDYEFTNPHILIHIDVPDANGALQHWAVEAASPNLAERNGWSKNTMKRGDTISYSIRPAKNGVLIGRGGNQVTINGQIIGSPGSPSAKGRGTNPKSISAD